MKRRPLLVAAALVGAACWALGTTPALAAAIVTQQNITTPVGPIPIDSDSCHPGATGTLTGTDTARSVTVQVGDQFHLSLTDSGPGRIDWTDGSYSIISSTDHIAFNAGTGTVVFADSHVDTADNYSPTGVLESSGRFKAVEHLTVTNGVITRVAFDFNFIQGTFC